MSAAELLGFFRPSRRSLLLVTPLDLFPRYIFDVSSDPPLVALRVFDAAGAVAIRLVSWFVYRLSARRHRALVNGVHVLHVQIEHGRFGCPLVAGLADHQHRTADAHFGMADTALVIRVAKVFLAAKRLLQKINLRFRIRYRQVGRYGVVAIRNWFHCHLFLSSGTANFQFLSLPRFASSSFAYSPLSFRAESRACPRSRWVCDPSMRTKIRIVIPSERPPFLPDPFRGRAGASRGTCCLLVAPSSMFF